MVSGTESAELKFIRAAQHFDALKTCVLAYEGRHAYEFIPQANGEEKIEFREYPPLTIAILTGEILYQIRSALDHLALDLVKLNPKKVSLPRDWDRSCYFPLKTDLGKRHSKPPLPKKEFTGALPGITKKTYALIERLQPYRRNAIADRLRLLAHLSNIDRHRYLNVTVAKIAQRETITTDDVVLNREIVLHDGAAIVRLTGHAFQRRSDRGSYMKVERSFHPFVAFDEPIIQTAQPRPVEKIIKDCLVGGELARRALEQLLKSP